MNLIALPTRLISTWRRWPASPMQRDPARPAAIADHVLDAAWPRAGGCRIIADARRAVRAARIRPVSQLELAGLDRRDVEHVLDQRQQRPRRGLDGVEALALFGVEPRRGQQFRHAGKAVQRRAELVAHVGEEPALRLVRAPRLLGRLGQRAQQAGQVQRHRDQADQQADAQTAVARASTASGDHASAEAEHCAMPTRDGR